MTVSTAIEIRRRNMERIRSAIQRHEKCTKADIARETALSMATCSTALNEMMKEGEVLKIEQTGFNIGRPADIFTYNKDYMHILALCTAIQNGEYVLEYAIADALGNVLEREEMPIDELDYALLEELVTACMIRDPLIRAVGLGVPGATRNGYIEDCDIPALKYTDFAGQLKQKHEVDVIVENDMNFITYHLYHRYEKDGNSFAAMYVPAEKNAYVGAGFIVHGRLLKGYSMMSGELYYAAKACGISLEQQQEALHGRVKFHSFVAKMISMIACTINPKSLVLMGNAISAEDIEQIRNICLQSLPEHAIPQLEMDNNMFENYIEGMIRYTLDSIMFPILI